MATVTIRGATSANTGSSQSATLATTLPVCSAGDQLYLLIGNSYSAATFDDPAGWTLVDSASKRNSNFGWMYTKTASAGDSASTVTVTFASAASGASAAIAVAGTRGTEVSDGTGSDGTSLTIPAITPGADDCLRMCFVSSGARGGTDTPGLTAPSGWTRQADDWSTMSSGNNIETAIFTTQLSGQNGIAQPTATIDVPGNSHSGLMFSVTAAPTESVPVTAATLHYYDGERWLTM